VLLLLLEESSLQQCNGGLKNTTPKGMEIFQEAAPYHRCIAEVSVTIFAAQSGTVELKWGTPKLKCWNRELR
jgi:hypothetical protein